MNKVSLVKSSRSYEGTLKVLEPLKDDLAKKIKNLDQIVVKVNFVSVLSKLAMTPFETVKAFVDFVKPFYHGKIIIAEEATLGLTRLGFSRGFSKLAKSDPQVEVYNSAKSATEKVKIKYPGGELELGLAKIYTEAPFIASICRAKTHDAVVVTLSLKNLLVGAIQQKMWARRADIHQGNGIHWILKEIAKHTYPDLAIIDGVLGMQGNGPVSGDPIKAGWLVASLDALLADSLAAYLMGFDVQDIGYFNLTKQADLGKLYPQDKVQIIGPDPKKLVTPFRPHSTFESQRRWQ